jgi:Kef-type K+ transport system membrane component KefB
LSKARRFFVLAAVALAVTAAGRADVISGPHPAPPPSPHAQPGRTWNGHALTEEEATREAEREILPLLLELALVLVAAKIGAELVERWGQPAVLGELGVGVLLGNLSLAGLHAFDILKTSVPLNIAAQVGVILLLFEVGLESKMRDLLAVGLSSLVVAVTGVVAPMVLGYLVGVLFLPEELPLAHVFLGATLCATSVGITARVLKDLNRTQTKEARIILGAAVIDDVLGLVVLAVVSGAIAAANRGGDAGISVASVAAVLGKSLAFLAAALAVGSVAARPLMNLMSGMRVPGVMLAVSVSMCFVLAGLAGLVGLAPIVGAFAAGLILEPRHFERFHVRGERPLEEVIQPLGTVFVPVFFVVMGLHVDLRSFGAVSVLGLAAALIAAAIAGKMACGLAVFQKGVDRLIVSVGMIPRGEVGLIFASIGAALVLGGEPVISPSIYSAVVVMVVVTTVITPFWLKQLFSKPAAKSGGAGRARRRSEPERAEA